MRALPLIPVKKGVEDVPEEIERATIQVDSPILRPRSDEIPIPADASNCQILVAPFPITIGKCAVIRDPFGTRLCILDMTKGLRPLNLAGSNLESQK